MKRMRTKGTGQFLSCQFGLPLFFALLTLFFLCLHRFDLTLDLLAFSVFYAPVGGMYGAMEILDEDRIDSQDGRAE